MSGHVNNVGALAFAADGGWLATADGTDYGHIKRDKLVRVWSLPLSPEKSIQYVNDDLQSNISTEDGGPFIADNEDIRWDSPSIFRRTIVHASEPLQVLGSLQNDRLLLATPVLDPDNIGKTRPAHMVDVDTGESQFAIHGGQFGVGHVAVAPDETWFATADAGVQRDTSAIVRIWDAASGALRHTLTGNGEGVGAVAISPDGALLITGDCWMEPAECVARVWRVKTAKVESVLPGHDGAVRSVRFANNGRWVATGDESGNVRIWNTETGQLQRTLVGSAEITDIRQSPNGDLLAVCEGLSSIGILRIWNPLSTTPIAEMRVDGPLYECRWSHDSRLLQASGIRGVYTFAWL
jgi:WD40 repeat protein